jgi:hypothetical protein
MLSGYSPEVSEEVGVVVSGIPEVVSVLVVVVSVVVVVVIGFATEDPLTAISPPEM